MMFAIISIVSCGDVCDEKSFFCDVSEKIHPVVTNSGVRVRQELPERE